MARTLRNQILLGAYAVGERLPGERELSETLGVSRLTLRSALTHLEAEGLVRTMHGSGTRVLDYRESAGLELFGHLAGLVLSGAPVPSGFEIFANLMELRRAVAIDAIGLAAERASDDELRVLRLHLSEQRALIGDPHAFMAHDLRFARLIVRATKNLAFELLFNAVMRTIEGHAGIELAFFANAETTLKVYARLLDRMEARDAVRARLTAGRLLERLDRATVTALSALLPRHETKPPAASKRTKATTKQVGTAKTKKKISAKKSSAKKTSNKKRSAKKTSTKKAKR
jgi:DNA-binding FadR family transcriptional regulator